MTNPGSQLTSEMGVGGRAGITEKRDQGGVTTDLLGVQMHLWAHDPWSAQDVSTSNEKCTPGNTIHITIHNDVIISWYLYFDQVEWTSCSQELPVSVEKIINQDNVTMTCCHCNFTPTSIKAALQESLAAEFHWQWYFFWSAQTGVSFIKWNQKKI